jgi:hypothetical protein
LSFFDEDDEPRGSATTRVRRTAPRGGATTDSQTLLIRRAVAGGFIVLVIVLLAVVVNSCRASQKRNGLKDYNRQVSAIATDSQQTGREFFRLLDKGSGQSPQDLQTQISSFRVQAEQQLKQGEGLSTPSEMKGAQQSLLIALEERRDGLDAIAQRIRTALGDQGDAADKAITEIAGQMRVFSASDVLWITRVVPLIKHALDDAEVGGQQIQSSLFLPDVAWLSPQFVAGKLGQQISGAGGRRPGQPTGPGLHGTGLTSTAYGNVTLQPSTSNRLPFTAGQPFVVTFANQGENDEFDVKVTVKITPAGGGKPISLTKSVSKVARGETAKVNLPLDQTPPIGAAATIQTSIAPVPGEKKTDNNTSQYPALFTRG